MRRNLRQLIAEVANGGEITITDRRRPVARLVAHWAQKRDGVPDLSELRKKMPRFDPPASEAITEDRTDRF